jgi:hypothetical protein
MEQPEGKKRKNTAPTLDERFCFLCPAFDDGRIRTQVDPIVTHIIEHHREECTRPGQHAETWLARRMEAGGTRVVRYEKGKQTPIHPHQYRQLEAPVVEFLAPAPVQLPAPLVNNVAGIVSPSISLSMRCVKCGVLVLTHAVRTTPHRSGAGGVSAKRIEFVGAVLKRTRLERQ